MNVFKRLFGFSDDYDEKDDDEMTSHHSTPYINPFKKVEEPAAAAPATVDAAANVDDAMDNEIVDKVIEILNATLPEYARHNIDIAAEKQYVQQLFGSTISDYVGKIRAAAVDNFRSNQQGQLMEIEKSKLAAEKQLAEAKAKVDELRQRAQTADQQKNIFKEKVQQLEQRIATAEAERDQYQLESKSLMNKLKVATVGEENLRALSDENAKLLEEMATLRTQLAEARAAQGSQNIQQIAETEAKLTEALSKLDDATRRLADTEALVAERDTAIALKNEALTKKDETIAAMQASAQSNDAELRQRRADHEALTARLAELEQKEQAFAQSARIIADLQEQVTSLTDEAYALKEKCNTHSESELELTEKVDELQSTLDSLSDVRNALASKDAEVAQLTATITTMTASLNDQKIILDERNADIERLAGEKSGLEDSVKQLQALVDNNLESQRMQELKLRQEIETLRAENEQLRSKPTEPRKAISFAEPDEQPSAEPQAVAEPAVAAETVEKPKQSKPRGRRKKEEPKKPVVSAIDYNFDYTDWLQPTPPTSTIPIKEEAKPDADADPLESAEISFEPREGAFDEPFESTDAPDEKPQRSMPSQLELF
ncbi:MAG: hypothetical protein PUE90_03120 [Bacteroidales bacterium]|nr:hypothetical protein [Bacteroidales bacterium]